MLCLHLRQIVFVYACKFVFNSSLVNCSIPDQANMSDSVCLVHDRRWRSRLEHVINGLRKNSLVPRELVPLLPALICACDKEREKYAAGIRWLYYILPDKL